MKISKDSWHYKMIDEYNGPAWMYDNLCSYTRALFFTILVLLIIVGFFGFVLGMLEMPFVYLIGYFVTGIWTGIPETYDGAFFVLGVLGWIIGGGIFLISEYGGVVKDKISEQMTDTLPYNMWKSFKDKVCFKVDFK